MLPRLTLLLTVLGLTASHAADNLKVFILAGDENVLRQGSIDGIPRGPGSKPIHADEAAKLPGTLTRILAEDPRFSYLQAQDGTWSIRNDVALYDAHPLSNVAKNVPHVASIDTVPFFFPKEKSPGGREWDYHNNAGSFLLIGEAMGKAIVELRKK